MRLVPLLTLLFPQTKSNGEIVNGIERLLSIATQHLTACTAVACTSGDAVRRANFAVPRAETRLDLGHGCASARRADVASRARQLAARHEPRLDARSRSEEENRREDGEDPLHRIQGRTITGP